MPEKNNQNEIILPGLTPLEESKNFATVTPVTVEEADRIIEEMADKILRDTLGVVPNKAEEEEEEEEKKEE